MEPLILVVEDEPSQMELLRYILEREGYRTITAGDGEEALRCLDGEAPDLVILDWMLPEVSGIEVCLQIRRQEAGRQLPILIVSARGEKADRTRAFEVGADDYLMKPFSLVEMTSRVRALLRRASDGPGKELLGYGDVSVDMARHRVSRGGRTVHLGPIGLRLLCAFLERPGHVYSRDDLVERLYGPGADLEPRTIDMNVVRLRKALNAGGEADIIRTVKGRGYALEDETSDRPGRPQA